MGATLMTPLTQATTMVLDPMTLTRATSAAPSALVTIRPRAQAPLSVTKT